ncbi:hypothetical protein Esti_004163 [Eimeria stiedai]
MRKKRRMGLDAEAFVSLGDGKLSINRSSRLRNSRALRKGKTVGSSGDEDEDSRSLASGSENFRRPEDDGSIGAAAAALKKQQQEQTVDTLHEEIRLLERRLCKHKCDTKDTEDARGRRMQKLRQELTEDGLDFELQSVLDDILSTRDQPATSCSIEKKEIDVIVHARARGSYISPGMPLKEAPGQFAERIRAGGRGSAACRIEADGESAGTAGNELNRQQQQRSGADRLQEEVRLLEKRLFTHRGERRGAGASATDRRKKLREELEKDGFDLELQDILDNILLGRLWPSKKRILFFVLCHIAADGNSRSSNSPKSGDFSDLESGFNASEEAATCIQPMSALKGFEILDGDESRSQPKTYVAPHRRQEASETDAATPNGLTVEAVKVEILQSQHGGGKQSSEEVQAYTVGVRHLLCEQLMQSCIKSRFSTNSLIATQTALCCALSKMWDVELCREFLRCLAVFFSKHFVKSLSLRTQQPEVVAADTASLVTRHSVVGLCCLYDFGFVSPRLFVELIRRVAGLGDAETSKESSSSLSDYRVELLLLLLRLGGGKLRQDDANLFTSTWKQLQGLVQTHRERAGLRADKGAPHAADELPAEAGRLRALIMELQDLKAGKQKDRLMLVKASQDAMRRWLNSNSVFKPTLLTAQYQIDGSWGALELGERPDLPKAAAAVADFQRHQRLRAKNVAAAADATVVGALASSMQHKASVLRFNTDLQKALFECLMIANGPDDALRALQKSGYLTLKKNTVTQIVAVTMQCCLQEKMYNEFYGMVLSRLCGICGCRALSVGEEATCMCFLLPDKAAARYRRTIQRGLAAQVSAAHGFPLRRLLNLATLTAFLIRLGITDLRIVRFLSFESSVGGHSPMGLTGKLGVFLREVCVELLCTSSPRASSPPAEHGLKNVAAEYFSCLRPMNDICEVFTALLQDVVLPDAKADGRNAKEIHTVKSTDGGKAVKASVVKAALNALMSHQQPEP